MVGSSLRVLVAHPFPDLYGADLMLLRSLTALRDKGCEVLLVVPEPGPLLDRVREAGIDHRIVPTPVLRKSLLTPRGVAGLAAGLPRHLVRERRLLRQWRPDVLYVNTLTLPHWLVAGRLAGVASVCHVRELESQTRRSITRGLTAPLLLAATVVANSVATESFLVGQHARLSPRTHVVYNGFSFPDRPPRPGRRARRRLTVVGRLSPRKGQDVAVRALSELTRTGQDVELELVGSVFPGYEWYEQSLVDLASELGVSDRLVLRGFQADVWAFYTGADIVAVPSRLEPFGSVAVEAMAAGRPVIVSDVGGLPEIVTDGTTGIVVPPDDPPALAAAVGLLLDDEDAARRTADRANTDARSRFSLQRYEQELMGTLERAAARSVAGRGNRVG